jgi:hypothetical protein
LEGLKLTTKFRLFDDELERILARKPSNFARKALVWANAFYGKRDKHSITYSSFSSFEIPPNKRGWHDVDWKEVNNILN